MEIFQLPLETTHLRHQFKWLSYIKHMTFREYANEVYRILDDPAMAKMWRRRRIVFRLLKTYGINDQRSQTWHTKRGEMITASEVTKAFKTATPSAKREIMLRKIEGPKPGEGGSMNAACLWGTQFEPVAKDLYCRMNGGGSIVDTSCVVHPVYPFLGASPDGIYLTTSPSDPRWGKLIEFKCPISRKFDENTPIPDAYYHQMQMQMECTDIDACDYVEMRFVTVNQYEWNTSSVPFKGRFAIYDDGTIHYDNTGTTPDWKVQLKKKDDEFRIVHWVLSNWRCTTVPRDFTWLPSHIDELKTVWEEICQHRLHGTIPEKHVTISDLAIDLHDAPSVPLPQYSSNQVISDCSLSVHKTNPSTLTFSLT